MLDKEEFFKEYKVEQEFLCSGLKWEVLEEIYDDYCRRQPEVEEYCSRFAEYFLDTRKTIKWAKDHHILVGPGRGSAAGSRMCYCLGITDLDPIPYKLLFERFLNPERISMPEHNTAYAV